ncbi:hypothetical protein J6590_022565 [Homalodisca vitripennis]|nr:hypothetical protein J6590_022565 [Homalodisca vitripennis]
MIVAERARVLRLCTVFGNRSLRGAAHNGVMLMVDSIDNVVFSFVSGINEQFNDCTVLSTRINETLRVDQNKKANR